MNSKKASYIALIVIIIVGLVYLKSAIEINGGKGMLTMGAGFFPILLASILIVLCIVSLIQTAMRTDNEKIDLPNLKLIVLTIIISALFLVTWMFFEYFYVSMFGYLLALMTVYYFDQMNKKRFIKNAVIALALTVLLYVVFGYLLNLNL